jgi:hypothetical protein
MEFLAYKTIVPIYQFSGTQQSPLILPNSCIPASQQLVPHFMILALSLNPVHEYSEFI